MKGKYITIGLAIFATALVLIPVMMPSAAFAASNPIKSNVLDPLSSLFALKGPLTVCVGAPSGNASSTTSSMPICNNLCDLVAQIANVIYFTIAVVIWIIAPILVAVGGVMIMLGGANPGMIETGKKTITGAVWGIVIVLCAWLIVYTFVNAFGGLGKYVGGFGGANGQAACTVVSPSSSGSSGGTNINNTNSNNNNGAGSSTSPFGGGDSGGGGASGNF
jgi:uncharacterized membrane protein YgcG